MNLKNLKDVEAFRETLKKCEKDVFLIKQDGEEIIEEFNLKSTLSEYLGIAELIRDHGDEFELFCASKSDEGIFMEFFEKMNQEESK